ncbi:hypothetical protein [Spiroplasma endosymbiont of Atherix ibis]|uniref:hypothetical protein n=1 Tax=Spiroplasma endosymbiont of Atherix ibis TaxID=3066291 RepID=UPI0030CD559D
MDFKITYESQKEDIWSKNDIVYINYIPFSKVLRGSIQFKLILLDLSTLDYSDVIPRNNQTKDKVKSNIINKIKKHSRNAEFNKDFYIEINSKTKLLKDGDIVTLYADPNSNMINGENQQFIVKTFNLNDVKQDFYKLNYKFNTSKEDIENQLNSLLYYLIPEAKINVDYKIEIENKYSVLYPGDKIKIKPISSSKYIIGNQIVLETPKLDIDFITQEIRNIKISIGNTNKDDYKKEVYENIQNVFKETKVLDELTFNFSKSKEFIVGDEEIIIKANLKSNLFLQNNKSIKIKTNKYNSKDIKKFLDNFLFTGLENSINITAGLQKEEVSKIINSLLSSSSDFKNLKENRDFKLEFQSNDKYLKPNEKFDIVVLKDSDFLEGNSFLYNIIDYDLKVMKPSFDKIEIKEGDYKKDINNKIKDFIDVEAPFINFEKDIEIKYTREMKENNSQDPNNGLGEDKELLTKNEKVEFVLKKNPLLTSKEQVLELLTIKSTNKYIDLSCLNNFNKVDFISESSDSTLQKLEYEITQEYLKILKKENTKEIKEFKDYLNSSFGTTVKDFLNILQINWYVKEKDSNEKWKQVENSSYIKENEMYMVKISFKKELYC